MCLLPFNLFRPIDEQRKGCFSCFSSVQLALHQLTLPQWLGLPVVFNFCKRVAVIPIVIMSNHHVVMSSCHDCDHHHDPDMLFPVCTGSSDRLQIGDAAPWQTDGLGVGGRWPALPPDLCHFIQRINRLRVGLGVVGGWIANTDCKTSESGTRSTSAQNLDERIFMSVILFRNSNYTGILLPCWNVPKLVIVC